MASAATTRMSNTTASLPIVYGSIAFYLGKKADESRTHEWTLFLRGPNQHDDHLNINGQVISKVVFELHQSFAQPCREIVEPPYEVTECGWGEFEAQIRIHWKDPVEQPTILNHTIKLYPQGTPPAGSANINTEEPVLYETYDEIVFTNPTQSFFQSLSQIAAMPKGRDEVDEDKRKSKRNQKKPTTITRSSSSDPSSSCWRKHLTTVYSDHDDFLALIAAQKFVREELSKVKDRFQIVTNEITVVDQKLLSAQQQKLKETVMVAAVSTSNNKFSSSELLGAGTERKRLKKSRPTSQNKRSKSSGNSTAPTAKRKTQVVGKMNIADLKRAPIASVSVDATTLATKKQRSRAAPATGTVPNATGPTMKSTS